MSRTLEIATKGLQPNPIRPGAIARLGLRPTKIIVPVPAPPVQGLLLIQPPGSTSFVSTWNVTKTDFVYWEVNAIASLPSTSLLLLQVPTHLLLMPTEFRMKTADTLNPLVATLSRKVDGVAVPVDLSEAEIVEFCYVRAKGGQPIETATTVTREAQIVDPPTSGQVTYQWTSEDTVEAGEYACEFRVTFSGGGIQTFPNHRYSIFEVLRSL